MIKPDADGGELGMSPDIAMALKGRLTHEEHRAFDRDISDVCLLEVNRLSHGYPVGRRLNHMDDSYRHLSVSACLLPPNG